MSCTKIAVFSFRLLLSIYLTDSQTCDFFPFVPLGMTDRFNGIKDDQITASSSFSDQTMPYYGRLHIADAYLYDYSLQGAGAWVALDQDDQQWIQIDLKTRKVVTSIATQGKQGAQQWVQDYHVLYTDSDVPVYWSIIKDNLGQPMLFDGNTDDNGVKINNFTYAIVARYIRLNPQRWYNLIALRMELFGCEYRPFVAHFDGTSWIDLRLDLPGRSTQTDRDEVRFRFRTREVNGLLLYGDSSQLDYFCIELYRGRLRVNVNLGAVPSSTEPTDNTVDAGSLLDDDQWHDVHIIREQKNLNISVDRIQVWRNLSAIFVHTNMNRNLSAGGLPHFSNRRGITVTQNFKGCIEEFVFNGVHLIRDAQRSLLGSQIVPAQDAATMRWDEALGYPKRNPFLWWGPPLTQNQLNITGFAIGGSGKLSTTCPPVTTDDSVIMFPGTKQYVVFLKIERESGAGTLQFSFQFRTLNRGGIMFYHTVDKDLNYISFGMEENKGHLELEIVLPGVNVIKYKIQNRDPAAPDGTFADGLWHDVQFTMRKDEVTLIIDNIVHTTIQKTTLPLSFDRVSYIGGGRPQRYGFQGCMRTIRVNSMDVVWNELEPAARHRSIINGSCLIQDRCSPNPCKHEAPCYQNGDTFFCDCTNTGYSGAVCHQSEYFTSCSEAGLFYALRNPFINITIDMDGSGVLQPIKVTCDFTDPSGVITVLPHDAPDFITVDGYQAPGSYRRKLVYDRADRETLGELVRRAVRCEQSITYQCWNAYLLRLPPGGGTTFQNRAWGWWVNRKGRPQFYWGGGVPGLQMCACGVEGTCTGDSLTCNCDSAGSTTPPLVDSGLLQFKDDLPVMEVRFGDTGGINDDKFSRYNVGPLRCFGDTLFDNTVTFRKADANLELPPLYSEFAFDMSFMFRTTITDAVIMQNNGRASSQFFEVRIRNGNSVRVAFNVGNGIQLVEVSTAHWLNDNTWHVVRFERNRKETRLIVDTQNPTTITEAIERSFRGFDFDQPLSVGTTQSFTDGFVGCLSNLLINGVVQDMRGLVERGVFTYGLSAGCVPKCEVNQCLNRGECVEHYSHYTCECGLTSYRGFICGREVGGTFNNGPMMKILLDRTQDRLGTVEEYIQVGFKTKSKRGILMEMRGSGDTNYIIVKVNNNGGITIEFDVGFKRFEVTTNYDIDLCNDQHHMVHAWRTDMGTKWHLKVDDYNEVVEDFSSYLSPSADVRLDDPWVIFMGRNDTMQAADGFDGCIYAAQWNNFFPLRMAFQDPRLANVQMLPANSIREDLCGFIEILPEPEPLEIRPSPAIPPNITPPAQTDDKERERRVVAGVVTGLLLILTVVALVLFCRHFTIERGDYETKEAKDASRVKTADMAIQFGRTGQPEVDGKEWWL
ncbi:Neurexin-4 [Paragonimus heterotremus]|uniref:Neurexin-4 n=1 Tax=Paragonimus heterotremus TaxID=100268 RepID=A0A8J4T0U0_9TREM|nr:Neurexin-4 [Paragonimus heterotremus]